MPLVNKNTNINKAFIAGIGIGDKPATAPVIPGISGFKQSTVNPYNKSQVGIQLCTSIITSYTKAVVFDGSEFGNDLSEFYAYRLNFIPVNEDSIQDEGLKLKVYQRQYPISSGQAATWADITGQVSRTFDLTKDILIAPGLNAFSEADLVQGWQVANQDLIFIRKSLIDVDNITSANTLPRCLVFRGGTQLSTISDDFTSDIDLNKIFYKLIDNVQPLNSNRYEGAMYLLNTTIAPNIEDGSSEVHCAFNKDKIRILTYTITRNDVFPVVTARLWSNNIRNLLGVKNVTAYSKYKAIKDYPSISVYRSLHIGIKDISVINNNENIINFEFNFRKESTERKGIAEVGFEIELENILISPPFYYKMGDLSGIPEVNSRNTRINSNTASRARIMNIDLYSRNENSNVIYGVENSSNMQDHLDEQERIAKERVIELDEHKKEQIQTLQEGKENVK